MATELAGSPEPRLLPSPPRHHAFKGELTRASNPPALRGAAGSIRAGARLLELTMKRAGPAGQLQSGSRLRRVSSYTL